MWIDPGQRERLKEEGIYQTFLLYREVMKLVGKDDKDPYFFKVETAHKFLDEYPQYAKMSWKDVAALRRADKLSAEIVLEKEIEEALPEVKAKKQKKPAGDKTVANVEDWSQIAEDESEDIGSSEEIRKAILWVFHNLATEKVDFKRAPNFGAVGLLKWVKSNAICTSEFYTKMLSKVIPTKLEEKPAGLPNDRAYDLVGLAGLVKRGMADRGIELPDGSQEHAGQSLAQGLPVELGPPERGKRFGPVGSL
jgi:hypothetical protein